MQHFNIKLVPSTSEAELQTYTASLPLSSGDFFYLAGASPPLAPLFRPFFIKVASFACSFKSLLSSSSPLRSPWRMDFSLYRRSADRFLYTGVLPIVSSIPAFC
jgi:hypothetical protein